jgi:hypothetical protein
MQGRTNMASFHLQVLLKLEDESLEYTQWYIVSIDAICKQTVCL